MHNAGEVFEAAIDLFPVFGSLGIQVSRSQQFPVCGFCFFGLLIEGGAASEVFDGLRFNGLGTIFGGLDQLPAEREKLPEALLIVGAMALVASFA